MEWVWFDRIVIMLIALNSILLGINDYSWDPLSGTETPFINQLNDNTEIVFTVFFTFEASVKIMSKGLILSNSCYLRDGWNWLDFTVVITGLM